MFSGARYPCPISIKRLESATDEANRAMRHIPLRAGDMFVFTEVPLPRPPLSLSLCLSPGCHSVLVIIMHALVHSILNV